MAHRGSGMADEDSFQIGELSARTGVPRHTIRFYERRGVLPEPERTASGYRVYGLDAVARLEFIGKGKALGLRLDDIREVLDISEGGQAPCEHVRELIEDRLREARTRLRQLEELRDTLRDTLAGFDELESAGQGCRCAVIERARSSTSSTLPVTSRLS